MPVLMPIVEQLMIVSSPAPGFARDISRARKFHFINFLEK